MNRQRGFTLLELLLAVGVGTVLMVGGINIYGMITKNIALNETARLVHIVLDAIRQKSVSNDGNYGTGGGQDITRILINTQTLPGKYINPVNNTVHDAYGVNSLITVVVDSNIKQFSISLSTPAAYIPEMIQRIDIAIDPKIVNVVACGRTVWNNGTGNLNPVVIGAACGASTDPQAGNIRILSR